MPINSNAIATVTVQDQDLLNPTQPNLVNTNATVTCPGVNGIIYSGYYPVTLNTFTSLLPSGANTVFAYIRNVSPVGGSGGNAILVQIAQLSGVTNVLTLFPGGIYLYANPVSLAEQPFAGLNVLGVAVPSSGQTSMIEYQIAF